MKALRLLSIVCLLGVVTACTTTQPPIVREQLPIGSDTPVAAPQQNDQVLRVTILNGKFDSSIYSEQAGATQMLVISTEGPYLFEIDRLVDRRELRSTAAPSSTTTRRGLVSSPCAPISALQTAPAPSPTPPSCGLRRWAGNSRPDAVMHSVPARTAVGLPDRAYGRSARSGRWRAGCAARSCS